MCYYLQDTISFVYISKRRNTKYQFLIMKRCPCNHYKAKTCLSFKRKKALWIIFMSYRISNLSKFCPQLGFSSLILSFSFNPFTLSALFFLSLSLFFHISWWNSEILNRRFWSIFLSFFGCFVCFSLQGKKETGMSLHKGTETCTYTHITH